MLLFFVTSALFSLHHTTNIMQCFLVFNINKIHKKFLHFDWLRAVQFFLNSAEKS